MCFIIILKRGIHDTGVLGALLLGIYGGGAGETSFLRPCLPEPLQTYGFFRFEGILPSLIRLGGVSFERENHDLRSEFARGWNRDSMLIV